MGAIYADDLDDWAWLLEQLDGWLTNAKPATRDDYAAFITNRSGPVGGPTLAEDLLPVPPAFEALIGSDHIDIVMGGKNGLSIMVGLGPSFYATHGKDATIIQLPVSRDHLLVSGAPSGHLLPISATGSEGALPLF
jgi:hypothetical protein